MDDVMCRACPTCGGAVHQGRRRGRPRVYCSKRCQQTRPGKKVYPTRRKDRSPIYVKDCVFCGRPYVARQSNGRFCGQTCRHNSGVVFRIWVNPCDGCGTLVTHRRTHGKWCASCGPDQTEHWRFKNRRRRQARVGTGEAGRYTHADIAERDGTDCHICGDPIDLTLSGNDLAGPTVDHLIPISKGGLDVFDNVTLAHRYCNVCRGAGDLEEWAA